MKKTMKYCPFQFDYLTEWDCDSQHYKGFRVEPKGCTGEKCALWIEKENRCSFMLRPKEEDEK